MPARKWTTQELGQSPGSPGELLVGYNELATLCKNCGSSESLRLAGTESETKVVFTLASQTVERPLTFFSVAEWPPVIEPKSEPMSLDESFKQALKEALECSSSDQTRYVLQGACLDITRKEAHYVVGTDGRHLYAANSFLFDIPTSLVIPARRFLSWPGFLADGPWRLRFDPQQGEETGVFSLQSAHWCYQAKPIAGNYPNWKQVVPADTGKASIQLTTNAVESILDALPLLPGIESEYQGVSMEVGTSGFSLKSIAKGQTQWTQIPITDATVTGSPTLVTLDRRFLSKALRFGLNRIDLIDEFSPVVFTAKGKKMVTMPLRGMGPEGAKETQSATESPANGVSPAKMVQETSAVSPSGEATAASPAVDTIPAPESAPTPTVESAVPTVVLPAPDRPNPTPEPITLPPRGNLTSHDGESKSGIKELIDRVEEIKASLRTTIGDLNGLLPALREAIREQKSTEKEIASVRSTLRSLQSVKL